MIREVLDSITYKRLSEFYSLVMGGSINEKDEFGYGILHSAISSEFDEAAIYYIEHGGDVNAQDNNGDNPRDLAEKLGNNELVRFFEQNGAKSNIKIQKNYNNYTTKTKNCLKFVQLSPIWIKLCQNFPGSI